VINSPSDLAGDDQFAERERDEHRDRGRAAAAIGVADALSSGTGRRVLPQSASRLGPPGRLKVTAAAKFTRTTVDAVDVPPSMQETCTRAGCDGGGDLPAVDGDQAAGEEAVL
jgi:hypothetical protein